MATKDIIQAAAGVGGGDRLYVEDVFSTYLYTGNGGTQTITNGIDLAGEGGLVWIKDRDSTEKSHVLQDTLRGAGTNTRLNSSTTTGQSSGGLVSSFNSNGFTHNGSDTGQKFVSWTFRKAPKFFDVVTYTGTGANRTVAHNLGSVPGYIIVKGFMNAAWQVYHRSLANTEYLVLNTTAAKATGTTRWNSTTPTSTVFSLGTDAAVNASGSTYVAYLFAHDAGGFGEDGTENVISCGKYTGNGAAVGNLVNVGFEPQWILIKASVSPDNTQDWRLVDNMRGIPMSDQDMVLAPNTAAAETNSNTCNLAPTGFYPAGPNYNSSGFTYIYIAIRRGPMKVPESGTEVFKPVLQTGNGTVSTGFPVDLILSRPTISSGTVGVDRLRGKRSSLLTNSSEAEALNTYDLFSIDSNTGYKDDIWGATSVYWNFRRAPGFFDVVAYSGTGSAQTLNHSLGVSPEMIIVKRRNGGGTESWVVQHSGLTGGIGQGASSDNRLYLNSTVAQYDSDGTFNFSPTSTTFALQNNANDQVNNASGTYIAYLFATLAGVSKVGSYTGTGTTKQIDCGFSGGARFVLIKRTDSTGDWYVWDSARGIGAGDFDPYLRLNSSAAEVTTTDYIDPYSAGFEISSTAPAGINASGGSYIFLAIA